MRLGEFPKISDESCAEFATDDIDLFCDVSVSRTVLLSGSFGKRGSGDIDGSEDDDADEDDRGDGVDERDNSEELSAFALWSSLLCVLLLMPGSSGGKGGSGRSLDEPRGEMAVLKSSASTEFPAFGPFCDVRAFSKVFSASFGAEFGTGGNSTNVGTPESLSLDSVVDSVVASARCVPPDGSLIDMSGDNVRSFSDDATSFDSVRDGELPRVSAVLAVGLDAEDEEASVVVERPLRLGGT